MLSSAKFSSLSPGWRSIHLIWRTFNSCIRPPGRSFADNAGGKGDCSDNLNAAIPWWWKFDQDALTISAVTEMYPMAHICLFWPRDSFCVARKFWLCCHISKMSWTLPILCNVLCCASLFMSKLLSVFVVSNTGSSPANNPVLAEENCLITTVLWWVLSVVVDCLQPITSRRREKLASSLIPCAMIENMLHVTLERSAQFECVSSYSRHQSVIPGIHNVLLISIGSEWWLL